MSESINDEPKISRSLGISSEKYYSSILWRVLLGLVLCICGVGFLFFDWLLIVASAIGDSAPTYSPSFNGALLGIFILAVIYWIVGAGFIAVPKLAKIPAIVLLLLAVVVLILTGLGVPVFLLAAVIPAGAAIGIIKNF